MKRRSVLDLLLGVGVLGFLGSVLYPVLRYLKPLGAQTQNGPIKLAGEDLAKLDKEHSVIVRAGATRIVVFEDSAQRLRALSARCTHEGCTGRYVPRRRLPRGGLHRQISTRHPDPLGSLPQRPLRSGRACHQRASPATARQVL